MRIFLDITIFRSFLAIFGGFYFRKNRRLHFLPSKVRFSDSPRNFLPEKSYLDFPMSKFRPESPIMMNFKALFGKLAKIQIGNLGSRKLYQKIALIFYFSKWYHMFIHLALTIVTVFRRKCPPKTLKWYF